MGTKQSIMCSKESPEEQEGLKCSDLDLPIFPRHVFAPILSTTLSEITIEQWKNLAVGEIDMCNVTLLSNMCQMLLDKISASVLEVVLPQVLAWEQKPASKDGSSSPAYSWMTRNYHHVTEADIQASLGDSLHHSFAVTLNFTQDSSHSDKLTQLFSAEVAKKVNHKLDQMTVHRTHPQEPPVQTETTMKEMVSHITHILKNATETPYSSEDESMVNPSSLSVSTYAVTDIESLQDEELVGWMTVSQSSDNLGSISSEKYGLNELLVIKDDSDNTYESNALPEMEFMNFLLDQDSVILAVILGRLLEHIRDSTDMSLFKVDFEGMVVRLRVKTGGNLFATFFKSFEKMHISIYEKLLQEFGSAELLQQALLSSDATFEEALMKALKAQVEKPAEETSSLWKRIKCFFNKRSAKVSPACQLSVGEEMPLPSTEQTQCCPSIFSTAAKLLRNPTCARVG